MQKFIKLRSPSRQLLETVNFAFIKIFDSLFKTALLGAFLLFLGDLRHKLWPKKELGDKPRVNHRVRFSAVICDTNHLRKAEKPQKGLF